MVEYKPNVNRDVSIIGKNAFRILLSSILNAKKN